MTPFPDELLLDDAALKKILFSRQKTAYGRHLALALQSGTLGLNRLRKLEDVSVREDLMKVKGIGTWTADIYPLLALQRPDVWRPGALAVAARILRYLYLNNPASAPAAISRADPGAGSQGIWRESLRSVLRL